MDIEHLVVELGGVASREQLVATLGRRTLERAVAEGRLYRVARGRYVLDTRPVAAAAVRAGGTVSHRSAALLHGWKVLTPPARPEITVPRHRTLGDRGKGAHLVWSDVGADTVTVGRVRVTTPLRTAVDCLRRFPGAEGLAVADQALRAGVTPEELVAAAEASPRTGRTRTVALAQRADTRHDNPFETALACIAAEVPGLSVEPQVQIGRARVDLADVRLRLVLEAESWAYHGGRDAFDRDVHRYTVLTRDGWTVLRFTWQQVLHQPAWVAGVLADTVARLARLAG